MIQFTTGFNQGDVVLIPFPFTDLSTIKQRPAIIISSNQFNAAHQDIIVATITSHIPAQLTDTDYLLSSSNQKSSGLLKASLVKLGKIVTIDQRLIRKKLGDVSSPTLEEIISHLHKIIG